MAFSKLSKNDEAVKDLDRAIEINDEYVKAFMKRADIYMM
jgi:Tfp pilus assembly protein PilF